MLVLWFWEGRSWYLTYLETLGNVGDFVGMMKVLFRVLKDIRTFL